MVNGCLQVTGFFLGMLGLITSAVTCFLPNWRKSDVQDEVIELQFRTTGLWVKCSFQNTGLYTCDAYDTLFLGLPTDLQASRALCVLSIILGIGATIICSVGLDCTNVSTGNPRLKARMVLCAGVLHVIGGIMVGAAVSWTANRVMQEYYNQGFVGVIGTRYIYGEALFVGWASMALSVICGLILCCSSWNSDDDDHGRPYTYNPPKSKPVAAEYI
ncbi:claudin-1-like [Clavelina lepadiformis]|uniref:Claudin n=1 Tax=Clavelina lepadiformis TaxID=159417 RepID=A0ABP0GMK8_CLALP